MSRNTFLWSPLFVRSILFTLLVLALGASAGVGNARAQDASVRDWNNTGDPLLGGVGLHYGQIGGHGLSFRMPLRWWLYFQVAGGVWHTSDKQQHNVGFNLNYILRQDQRTRIFISAGTAYFYRKEDLGNVGGQETYDLETNWNLGGGVGIEYLQGRRWAWKIEADFAHLGKSGDIKVVPQAGIAYYW